MIGWIRVKSYRCPVCNGFIYRKLGYEELDVLYCSKCDTLIDRKDMVVKTDE